LTFDEVITLMETFDKVMDGQILDQLYGFRQSDEWEGSTGRSATAQHFFRNCNCSTQKMKLLESA
jgi:hypothetical protein